MTIEAEELADLKAIYFKHYGVTISDSEATVLGTRLLNLFRILVKHTVVDLSAEGRQNGYENAK